MHFKYNIVNRNRGSDKRQVASDKLQSCGSRFPAVYMRRGGLPEGHGDATNSNTTQVSSELGLAAPAEASPGVAAGDSC